jgi:F-type H+-transporting ATPase subunit delta
MKPAAVGRFARAVLSAAAAQGRLEPAVDALARAAAFFGTEDGALAADVLQSRVVPAAERRALREEIAKALELPREVAVFVETLSAGRALGVLPAVAARASSVADAFRDFARVEVRTARALPEDASEGILERIGAAMEKILRRPVRVEVSEDQDLLAGMVVRAGDRIWDGSLRGWMARSREALSAGDVRAATQGHT